MTKALPQDTRWHTVPKMSAELRITATVSQNIFLNSLCFPKYTTTISQRWVDRVGKLALKMLYVCHLSVNTLLGLGNLHRRGRWIGSMVTEILLGATF